MGAMQATVSSVLYRYGATYTIRKRNTLPGLNSWTEGAEDTATYHTCRARRRAYKPAEIRAGGFENGDSLVVVDASSIAVAPQKDDAIALGTHTDIGGAIWHQIVDVEDPGDGDEFPVYRLRVGR